MSPATVRESLTVELDIHPDCADFHTDEGHQRTLAVGTYELDETTQIRNGKLYTYRVEGNCDDGAQVSSSSPNTASLSLQLEHAVVDLPGIFDMHFAPISGTNVVLALADGSIRMIDVCTGSESASTGASPAMALTVDTLGASPTSGISSGSPKIAASYSDGSIKIFDVTPDGGLVQLEGLDWGAHSLEAWMATWSREPSRRGNVVYSGGDDAIFQAWDLRESNGSNGSNQPARLFVDRKTHGAGVTCVGELGGEHTVMTGSYDNNLRIWDWRNSMKPVVEASLDLGGGVWRLKPKPDDPTVVLAATMYDGFKLLRLKRDGAVWIEHLADFPTQRTDKTLAYGASWCQEPGLNGLAATCSFYDNLLSLWNISL